MKTLKCYVKCQFWNQPEPFEVEVDENATDDEIEAAMREAAIDAAKLEFWAE